MWILFVIYAAFADVPKEYIVVKTEFPLVSLEECVEEAEKLAVDSMTTQPILTPYKFYMCSKESI